MSHGALGPLAFWEGYENELTTLAIYTVGLALYALFVGAFYTALSERNLVRGWKATRRGSSIAHLGLFPLISFGMFLVLSIALFFLAKDLTVPEILLLSMAVVGGVRLAAYISNQAAGDLAKLLPLGLLGVVLVQPGFLSLSTPFARITSLPGHLDLIVRYLLAIIVLEVGLRVAWVASGGPKRVARAAAKAAAKPKAEVVSQQAPTPAPPAAPAGQGSGGSGTGAGAGSAPRWAPPPKKEP